MTTSHRISMLGAALTIAMACTTIARADEPTWFGQSADGKWMAGVKLGVADTGNSGYGDADTWGIVLGYQFARPVGYQGSSSLEFEALNTYNNGDIRSSSSVGGPGDWDADTLGVYFAYRTPGTVFFKAKLGAVQTKIHNRVPGERFSTDDTSLGYGAGFGVHLAGQVDFNLELEFAAGTSSDSVDQITLGGVVLF